MFDVVDDLLMSEITGMLERFNARGLTITADTRLRDDLEVDSVAAMDLLMEIENRYDIELPINLMADVETVQDLVALAARNVSR